MDDPKRLALACLEDVKAALAREPSSAVVERALYQCERLEHAVAHAHAEGVRFAAFTLSRAVTDSQNGFGDATKRCVEALKAALDAAGHHF